MRLKYKYEYTQAAAAADNNINIKQQQMKEEKRTEKKNRIKRYIRFNVKLFYAGLNFAYAIDSQIYSLRNAECERKKQITA